MQRGYGIFLWLISCAIFYLLLQANWKGYAHTFSDWSNPRKCDYVTNLPVYQFYSGDTTAKWFRVTKPFQYQDTLVIGMDYYALFPIVSIMLNDTIVRRYAHQWESGKVIYLEVINGQVESKGVEN